MLEQDGLRVELPAGFTLAEDEDTWRATGLDPDFRLHMAVEQLYNLPAHTMAEQVLRDIEADPETQLVDTNGHSLTYLEFPGDGSEVLWKTWPHDNCQIFVASPHAHRAEHRAASNVPHGIRLRRILTARSGLKPGQNRASSKKFLHSFSRSRGFQKVFCKTMEPEGRLASPNK